MKIDADSNIPKDTDPETSVEQSQETSLNQGREFTVADWPAPNATTEAASAGLPRTATDALIYENM
jgi:hypothetical protein